IDVLVRINLGFLHSIAIRPAISWSKKSHERVTDGVNQLRKGARRWIDRAISSDNPWSDKSNIVSFFKDCPESSGSITIDNEIGIANKKELACCMTRS